MKIRIGTRGSELAMWQANYVADRLGRENTEIIVIKTRGDHIQNVSFTSMEGKGFFTKEIEEALLSGQIDLAVHSLKDLPTENTPGLEIAAVPEREDPADLLLVRKDCAAADYPLSLGPGAVVGTSSMRRLAQLRAARPDLNIKDLRGNVNTRLKKLREGQYDAIVLASAGLKRLEYDLSDLAVIQIPYEIFLPAPGQGALGLQIREGDGPVKEAVSAVSDRASFLRVTAERAFLNEFGGGCHIPLGALAVLENELLTLEGLIAAPDGSAVYRSRVTGTDAAELGKKLAVILKEQGAEKVL